MHRNALKKDLNAGGIKMPITVKYLEGLGIEKEVAEQIFAERGKEIALANAEKSELTKQLTESKETFEKLNKEFETLKSVNADGADWKAKFEALKADNEAKEKQAEADRITREKTESIEKRFNDVVGEKQFYNEPTREFYLKKFTEALEDKANEGVGDKDLFHTLVKDDGTAWRGVEVVKLPGGNPTASNVNIDEAKARAIMGLPEK